MSTRHTVAKVLAATALAGGPAGCDTSAQTVGPMGGLVVSEDGRFSLDIPQGALDHEVDIEIRRVECTKDTALGACYATVPRGTAFVLPAEVAYELADMDLANVDPERLGVIAERTDGWRVLADRDVDMEDEVVYASAMYLSSFALVPVE